MPLLQILRPVLDLLPPRQCPSTLSKVEGSAVVVVVVVVVVGAVVVVVVVVVSGTIS